MQRFAAAADVSRIARLLRQPRIVVAEDDRTTCAICGDLFGMSEEPNENELVVLATSAQFAHPSCVAAHERMMRAELCAKGTSDALYEVMQACVAQEPSVRLLWTPIAGGSPNSGIATFDSKRATWPPAGISQDHVEALWPASWWADIIVCRVVSVPNAFRLDAFKMLTTAVATAHADLAREEEEEKQDDARVRVRAVGILPVAHSTTDYVCVCAIQCPRELNAGTLHDLADVQREWVAQCKREDTPEVTAVLRALTSQNAVVKKRTCVYPRISVETHRDNSQIMFNGKRTAEDDLPMFTLAHDTYVVVAAAAAVATTYAPWMTEAPPPRRRLRIAH